MKQSKAMNIQAEKLEIMKLILDTDNPSLLASVKSLFNIEAKKDFWQNLSQEHKNEILIGIDDMENGRVCDYEEFIGKHR